jgi:hypothetical protein
VAGAADGLIRPRCEPALGIIVGPQVRPASKLGRASVRTLYDLRHSVQQTFTPGFSRILRCCFAIRRSVVQALLLIATQLLPELIQIIARDQSGRAKEKIFKALKYVTNGDDSVDLQKKLDEDADVKAELRRKLSTIALEEAIDQSRDRDAARLTQESMERGERVAARLTIPTNGSEFPLLELQTVLNAFRGYYCMALDYYLEEQSGAKDAFVIAEKIALSAPDFNDDNLQTVIDNGLLEIPYHQDLILSDIKRDNPIELILAGIGYPLAAAVILSGGQFKFGPIVARLPPIGDGIKKLREALKPISAKEIQRPRPKRLDHGTLAKRAPTPGVT